MKDWNIYKAHPETSSRGSNSRNDPGVWLWYSDSTRRAEHAHIGGTSQRVANSGVRALWSWKFWKKKCVFSQLGGARTPFKGLNESTNHKLLFGIQNFPICGTPFPLWLIKCRNSKNRAIFLLKPHLLSPKDLPTQFFCSAVF